MPKRSHATEIKTAIRECRQAERLATSAHRRLQDIYYVLDAGVEVERNPAVLQLLRQVTTALGDSYSNLAACPELLKKLVG